MPTSETLIRAADLSADRAGILAVLERNLAGAGAPERFDWLYHANPDGPARVWVAEDEQGEIVGTSAAYPRRMRVQGAIVRALVLSDFAFDPGFRSLGPALRLLKATLAPVRENEYAFSYDFPSETMRAIYRRLGAPDLGPGVRWVRPLKLSGSIQRKLGSGAVAAATGAAADALLAVRDSVKRAPRNVEVREFNEPFGRSFDALDAELGKLSSVVGVRDAAYLNWKYGGHTMWPHRTLAAHCGGTLAGFAVWRITEERSLRLVDLFTGAESVRRALVAELVRLGRKHGAERIEVEALANGGFSPMLGGLGFVRREEGVGPVPYLSQNCPARESLTEPNQWWLNGGDRDI